MSDRKRERALNQIVTLKRMAEDTSTTEGERQAARDTITKLRKKYDIPENTPDPATPRPQGTWGTTEDAFFTWYAQEAARRREADKQTKQKQAERERAQQAWNERFRFTDNMGRPLSAEERAEAMRDPFAWAQKQDGRTHAQKQRDMDGSWGSTGRAHYAAFCNPPASYYDHGGERRRRNGVREKCVKCDQWLYVGSGGWDPEAGGFVCTETIPGPRKKRSEEG